MSALYIIPDEPHPNLLSWSDMTEIDRKHDVGKDVGREAFQKFRQNGRPCSKLAYIVGKYVRNTYM